ncbi:MAG: YheT family hydrolase [Candidatus Rokuibacteriota bacterium]
MWGPLFRREAPALRRERLPTPDGDFVDLDWLAGDAPAGAPLMLVLHGLEGSTASHYVRGLVACAGTRGWRAAALNFRSCSGEMNRLPRFYHSGDTADLDHVVAVLTSREPGVRVGLVGVSLGGNVLLKWLGELGAAAPPHVVGAVGISVPYDLEACVRRMDAGFQKATYTVAFMRSFKRKIRAKAHLLDGLVDLREALGVRTFAEYDRVMTAPLHGFADEEDYWRRASSGPYLAGIRRPALVVGALDDPFVPSRVLPDPSTLPPGVRAEFVRHGGHVGFMQGRWPWRLESWAERRAIEFLAGLL